MSSVDPPRSVEEPPRSTEEPPRSTEEPPARGEPVPLACIPWEQRRELGRLSALWQTLLLSLAAPARLFRAMPEDGPTEAPSLRALLGPLTYAGWMTIILFTVSLVLMALSSFSFTPLALLARMVVFQLVLVFVYSLIVHLVLAALRAATRRFIATFRVVCYSSGATLLNLVPIFGGTLALGWGAVMLTVGVAVVHGTGWAKAIAAVVAPYLLVVAFLLLRVHVPGFAHLSLWW